MKYSRSYCNTCGSYTLHFGLPYPIHCIRHNADEELEKQIRVHEFESKTQEILRTAVDWTFLYMQKKEMEAENAGV